MSYKIPQNIREILEPLSEAIFPLESWTRGKVPPRYDQFIPPLRGVPWRSAQSSSELSMTKLDIVRFLELSIDHDGANDALASRWRDIKADPLKNFHSHSGLSASDWRNRRQGLSVTATFGAFDPDSSNFAFVTLAPDGKPKDTVSRKDFYASCWSELVASFQARSPADAVGWAKFRGDLRGDLIPQWPTTNPVRSSSFIRQFAIDILTASLGQKNEAIAHIDPLFQRSALIEIGENRHQGNRYTVQQAKAAVDTFVEALVGTAI